jgi:hypothetical protein
VGYSPSESEIGKALVQPQVHSPTALQLVKSYLKNDRKGAKTARTGLFYPQGLRYTFLMA